MPVAAGVPPAFVIRDYVSALPVLAAVAVLVLVLLHRYVLRRIDPLPSSVAAPWWRKILTAAGWAGLLLVVALLVPALLGSFAPSAAGFRPFAYPQSPVGLVNVGRVVSLFLAQSLWEELIFRGILMGGLGLALSLLLVRTGLERGRAWALAGLVANGLQALIFAFVHRGNPGSSTLSLLNIALAGVLLGALYWRQGGLFGAWTFHFLWNFGLAASGLPVSGVTTTPALLPLGIAGAREDLVSGGRFGPEGSLVATLALAAVAFVTLRNRRPTPPAQDGPPPAG